MALVNDDVAVLGNPIVDDALSDEALNDRDVQQSGRPIPSTTDASDRLGRNAEESRQPLDPLIEQLPSMHEHQRVHAALRDQPRGNNGLAERGRRRKDPHIMSEHRVGGGELLATQLALKRHIQRHAAEPLVTDAELNTQRIQGSSNIIETAARQVGT